MLLMGRLRENLTYIRDRSSGIDWSERHLRYSNHLRYFLFGHLLVTSIVNVRIDPFAGH